MTEADVTKAALTDPDAMPMTAGQLARMRRAPDVKALGTRLV